jgi:hypothetical protein
MAKRKSKPPVTETIPPSLEAAILENVSKPRRVQSEVGSVEQHSLQDLIAADKYLQQKRAAQNGGLPFRLLKIENRYE